MHWYEFTEEEVSQAMYKYGHADELEEGRDETLISSIRNLMVTLNLNAKQAMDALKIPADQQKKYLSMI